MHPVSNESVAKPLCGARKPLLSLRNERAIVSNSILLCVSRVYARTIEGYRMYRAPVRRGKACRIFMTGGSVPASDSFRPGRSISIVIRAKAADRTIENLAGGYTRISRFTAPPMPTPSCFPYPRGRRHVCLSTSISDGRDIRPLFGWFLRTVYVYEPGRYWTM